MLKRFAAISLTVYFLILSIGIGVSTHLCGGKAMSKAIFVEAPSCGHAMDSDSCNDHNKATKGCCDHEYELVQLKGDYLFSSHQHTDAPQVLVALIPAMPILAGAAIQLSHQSITTLRPPPKQLSQRLALFQSYLC